MLIHRVPFRAQHAAPLQDTLATGNNRGRCEETAGTEIEKAMLGVQETPLGLLQMRSFHRNSSVFDTNKPPNFLQVLYLEFICRGAACCARRLKFPLWERGTKGDLKKGFSTIFLSALCVFAVFASFAPSEALAHNVSVFAYVEGDTVVTESYFNDGRKCRECTIDVFDRSGNKLLDGKTNMEGQFSFKVPAKGDLIVRLTASMGHMAEYTLTAEELPGGKSGDLSSADPGATQSNEHTHRESGHGVDEHIYSEAVPAHAEPSLAEIEQAVDRAVSRQLLPIRRALEESRRKQRFSDIVGGIGYIVGLMGLILYFRSRQRRK